MDVTKFGELHHFEFMTTTSFDCDEKTLTHVHWHQALHGCGQTGADAARAPLGCQPHRRTTRVRRVRGDANEREREREARERARTLRCSATRRCASAGLGTYLPVLMKNLFMVNPHRQRPLATTTPAEPSPGCVSVAHR